MRHDRTAGALGNRGRGARRLPAPRGNYPRLVVPTTLRTGTQASESDSWFPFVCHGDHPLPAVILAIVVGHRGGTCGHGLGPQELDQAITLLAPAEASRDFKHPNLAAWRLLQQEAEGLTDPKLTAVFRADPESVTQNIDVLALRHAGTKA